jgi:DUF971 family protein
VTPRLELAAGNLIADWNDLYCEFSAAQLRARCRCAGCRSAARAGRLPAVPGNIAIVAMASMGYGVQLQFSDGHQRGIYPWIYLRELAARPDMIAG